MTRESPVPTLDRLRDLFLALQPTRGDAEVRLQSFVDDPEQPPPSAGLRFVGADQDADVLLVEDESSLEHAIEWGVASPEPRAILVADVADDAVLAACVALLARRPDVYIAELDFEGSRLLIGSALTRVALPATAAARVLRSSQSIAIKIEDDADLSVVKGEAIVIVGTIENRSLRELDFGRREPGGSLQNAARIGLTLVRAGEAVGHFRAAVYVWTLRPDDVAHFEVSVETHNLPIGEYAAEFGVLWEHRFWLDDSRVRLPRPLVVGQNLYRSAFHWRRTMFLTKERRNSAVARIHDSGFFEKFQFGDFEYLSRFSKSHYTEVKARRFPAAVGADRPILALSERQVPGFPPLMKLVLHQLIGASGDLPATKDLVRQAFEIIRGGPALFYGRQTPLADAVGSYLLEPGTSPHIVKQTLPRLAFLAAFSFAELDNWARELDWRSYWFRVAFLGQNQICARLTPPDIADHLNKADSRYDSDTFPASTFMRKLNAESEIYSKLYNLNDLAARVAFAFDLVLHAVAEDTSMLGLKEQAEIFAAPATSEAGSLTLFEIIIAFHVGKQIVNIENDLLQADEVRHWFYHVFCRAYPKAVVFSSWPCKVPPLLAESKIDVVGIPLTPAGLGENMLMTLEAFEILRVPTRTWSLERNFELVGQSSGATKPRRPVTIFHMNADRIPQMIVGAPGVLSEAYKIGFFLWELERAPASHQFAMDLVDEIWVPSDFVASIYASSFNGPIINVGKGVDRRMAEVKGDKAAFGFDPDKFTFLISFDFNSYLERKNPLAGVRAFRKAFAGNRSVEIVIKVPEVVLSHPGDPHDQWGQIVREAAVDDRIKLVASRLEWKDYARLLASADCILSPHRAEGFGYLPLYGFALRKPVLLTDFSGPRDFCDESNSYPVRFSRSVIGKGDFLDATAGQTWADIDVDHLAERLQELLDDPVARTAKIDRAFACFQERYTREAIAARYAARLAALNVIEA